jgi:hypothetical protein
MRFLILPAILGIVGIFFVASAFTAEGLLPSGHGAGWVSELVIGMVLLGYAAFRIRQTTQR